MKRLLTTLAVLVAVFAQVKIGFAEMIYDNGFPDTEGLVYSDFDFSQQMGDDFVLNAGKNVITGVHWWGCYDPISTPPLEDDFTIRFFAISGGTPESTALHDIHVGHVTRTEAGLDIGSEYTRQILDVFEYWAQVPPIALAPGEGYFLSIVDNTADTWGS